MKFAPNSLYFYKDLPPEKQFAEFKKAGFDYLEILFPYFIPLNRLKELLSGSGLSLSILDVLPGDITKMEINAAVDPRRKEEFRRNAETAVLYASELSVKNINCLSGIISATPGVSREKQMETFTQNLMFLCSLVKNSDIMVLLEPICEKVIPNYHFYDLFSTVKYLEEHKNKNLGLQFDFYHMQMLHGNLLNNVKKYFPLIGYFQIANAPERNEPDAGEINFPFLLKEVTKLGYTGVFGLEYIPSRGMEETFSWRADLGKGF